jgi:ketosteroid isomerase-like protein
MSSEPEDITRARGVFETMNEHGVEAALPEIDPEFEMTTPPDLASEPDTFRGHDGIRRWFDSFYDAMEEVRIEPGEMREAGPDHVAIEFRLIARGRSSGLEFNQQAVMLTTLREGLLLRIEYFGTLGEAVAEGRARCSD